MLLSHAGADGVQGAVQVRSYGVDGHLQNLADFSDGKLFEKLHQEDGALIGRQFLQNGGQVADLFLGQKLALGAGFGGGNKTGHLLHVERGGAYLLPEFELCRADMIPDHVECDAGHPGGHAAVATKAFPAPVGAQKRVLGNGFSQIGVAGREGDEAENARPVGGYQRVNIVQLARGRTPFHYRRFYVAVGKRVHDARVRVCAHRVNSVLSPEETIPAGLLRGAWPVYRRIPVFCARCRRQAGSFLPACGSCGNFHTPLIRESRVCACRITARSFFMARRRFTENVFVVLCVKVYCLQSGSGFFTGPETLKYRASVNGFTPGRDREGSVAERSLERNRFVPGAASVPNLTRTSRFFLYLNLSAKGKER